MAGLYVRALRAYGQAVSVKSRSNANQRARPGFPPSSIDSSCAQHTRSTACLVRCVCTMWARLGGINNSSRRRVSPEELRTQLLFFHFISTCCDRGVDRLAPVGQCWSTPPNRKAHVSDATESDEAVASIGGHESTLGRRSGRSKAGGAYVNLTGEQLRR